MTAYAEACCLLPHGRYLAHPPPGLPQPFDLQTIPEPHNLPYAVHRYFAWHHREYPHRGRRLLASLVRLRDVPAFSPYQVHPPRNSVQIPTVSLHNQSQRVNQILTLLRHCGPARDFLCKQRSAHVIPDAVSAERWMRRALMHDPHPIRCVPEYDRPAAYLWSVSQSYRTRPYRCPPTLPAPAAYSSKCHVELMRQPSPAWKSVWPEIRRTGKSRLGQR